MLFLNGKIVYLWMSIFCVVIRFLYIKYMSFLIQYFCFLKLGVRIKDMVLFGKRIQYKGGFNLKFKILCVNDLLKCKNNFIY